MEEQNKKERHDRIEELKKELSSKNFKEKDIFTEMSGRKHDPTIVEDWQNAELADREINVPKTKKPIMEKLPLKKIFIGSLIFFTAAFSFAFAKIYLGGVFSADKINISINGPLSIAGGEKLDLTVNVTNNNDTAVETADLIIEYPPGAYESFDSQESLPRVRRSLGEIAPNETINEQVQAVLFGEQNSEKEIRFILEFRFKGSNATLEKEEVYNVRITSSPIDLSLDVLDELTAGQETTLVVEARSNSNKTIEDLLIEMDYPFGFEFSGASPMPSFGNSGWEIGDLAPGARKTIRIKGSIEGQQGEDRVFNAYVGSRSDMNKKVIGTIYNSVSEETTVAQPFLALDVVIEGSRSAEYSFASQKQIRADLLWDSTLLTKIIDGKLEVKLGGEALDKFSVSPGSGGFYRSIDNTIVWDKNTTPPLGIIEPGANGQVSFSLASLPLYTQSGGLLRNPEITIEVNAKAKRVSDTNVPEELNTSIQKKIKIESDMRLAPRSVYYEGPYVNTGPIPPRAEQETTYTIMWTVTNSSNDIKDAKVRTTLPTYASWLGAPGQSENITFNEVGGEVVWNLGEVEAGAGITKPAREVAFQIVFLPSVSQIRRTPALTGDIILSGEDTFTGTLIKSISSPLTTKLSTDPNAFSSNGIVQP